MKLYYLFKFWMRDVAIFRNEFGTPLGFTNEIGWLTLLALKIGINLSVFGILYFVTWAFIIMGLIGKFFRQKKIPEMNNTLQNELNKELMEILKRLERIEEKLK